jgi:hypothetical protein
MKAQSTLLKRVLIAVIFVLFVLFVVTGLVWGIGSLFAPGLFISNSPTTLALLIATFAMFFVVDRRAKPTKQRAK